MNLLFGAAVLAATVWALARRVDVRLALLAAALALGAFAGQPQAIVGRFFSTLVDEKFVVPLCCAMGFAYVIRHTGCDRHLVRLLVRPLRRARPFLIPGAVLVGWLVNIPVISQTSTAVTVGAVLIPLLLAARVSPVTAGATLLLGSSVGGELLNPGAPELRTVVEETGRAARARDPEALIDLQTRECVALFLPLDLLQLGVTTLLFWALSTRFEKNQVRPAEARVAEAGGPETEAPLNLLRAAMPLVPLALLFLTGPPLELIPVPRDWLVEPITGGGKVGNFDSRLIGAAMLAGVAATALAVPRQALELPRAFFEGMGYAFTHIISLIVTASCFGRGIELIGLDQFLGKAMTAGPALLFAAAGSLPLGFAALSGSGFGATQSLFPTFAGPALELGLDPVRVGAVVSLAAAAGRTLSPVAAVTLMCAQLTQTSPLDLIRRLLVPVLAGVAAVVVVGALLAGGQ